MPRMTNEDLANVIGGIDDRVATLGKDVKKDLTLVQTQIGELKESVDAANGRQRKDHDAITGLETKLGVWGGAQAMFTTVAAIIAGLVGIQK